MRRTENRKEKSDTKRRRQAAIACAKCTLEDNGLSRHPPPLSGVHDDTPAATSAEVLSDPRLNHPANAVEKTRLLVFLQKRHGNSYLQRVVGHCGFDSTKDFVVSANREMRRECGDCGASATLSQPRHQSDSSTGREATDGRELSVGQRMRPARSAGQRGSSDSGTQSLGFGGSGPVIQLTPQGRARAEELRAALLRGVDSGTGAEYGTLDRILVNRSADQVDVHDEYTRLYGAGSLMRDLQAFVEAIPGTAEMRSSMRDRWTARLYDAGIGEAQTGFQEARPVPVNAENERRWPGAWIAYFRSPGGSGLSHAPLALWILTRWSRIHAVEQIQRRDWMPPRQTEIRRASFGILSQQPTVHDEGIENGNTYFSLIHSAFIASLTRTVAAARSYQQSYTAAHWPLWNPRAQAPPIRDELRQAILDWHSINSRGRLPDPEGEWISHWRELLRSWDANQFVSADRLSAAGMAGQQSPGP